MAGTTRSWLTTSGITCPWDRWHWCWTEPWAPGLLLLFVVILLFPDGRLPSRSWRWALRAYCALYAALLAALAVATADAIIGCRLHRLQWWAGRH